MQLIPGAPGFNPEIAYKQWVSWLFPAAPAPTLSITGSEAGLTVTLNVAGTLSLSVSGSLGSYSSGSTLLAEQGLLKQGFLTLSANGSASKATAQYVVLGTSGDDTFNANAAGNRVDYVWGGAGNDDIRGGEGDDVLLGGTGNDHITGGAGVDTLSGGDGNDRFYFAVSGDLFAGGQAVDSIDGPPASE